MIGRNDKRGQEEITGFVLIVVIVSVVFVILLAIFLRSPKTQGESADASQFLESMMRYTSDCAIGYEPRYSSVGRLLGDCYEGKVCVSGKNACDVLNETIGEVIKSSFGISAQAYYVGYRYDASYNSSSGQRNIISLGVGNCSYYRGADYFFSQSGGTIDMVLKLCTNS